MTKKKIKIGNEVLGVYDGFLFGHNIYKDEDDKTVYGLWAKPYDERFSPEEREKYDKMIISDERAAELGLIKDNEIGGL